MTCPIVLFFFLLMIPYHIHREPEPSREAPSVEIPVNVNLISRPTSPAAASFLTTDDTFELSHMWTQCRKSLEAVILATFPIYFASFVLLSLRGGLSLWTLLAVPFIMGGLVCGSVVMGTTSLIAINRLVRIAVTFVVLQSRNIEGHFRGTSIGAFMAMSVSTVEFLFDEEDFRLLEELSRVPVLWGCFMVFWFFLGYLSG